MISTITIILSLFILACLYMLLSDKGNIKKANRNLLAIEPYSDELKNAIAEMDSFMGGAEYFDNRKYESWIEKYEYLSEKTSFNFEKATIREDLKDLVRKYIRYRSYERKTIDEYNNSFIDREAEATLPLLKRLKIENNAEQRKSMVCGEDSTLVVAGAGTGKTQTIWGKVAYIYHKQNIKPEEILLLSFTKKAANELEDRIAKIDEKLRIGTFNGLGYEIIGEIESKRPSVAFDNDIDYRRFINKTFNDKLVGDSSFAKVAIDYFSYYLYPVALFSKYDTKDEYYKSFKTGRITTFKREVVKSAQEAMIANFLYMHSIDYEYEAPYKYDTSNKDYAKYKPDFYLPDYDIYLEHFGIDRNGETHYTTDEEQNGRDSLRYKEDMKAKREMHALHKTRLIETYSYEFQEKNWRKNLTDKLAKQGVRFKKRSEAEILEEIRKGEYISLITPLICTFLNLIKSRNYSLDAIEKDYERNGDARGMAFIKIFKPILECYAKYLKENHLIDFNDMILNAARYIEESKYIHGFKHIIIDEFQDFSFSKYALIKAMLEQNPQTKLFCVGDDWQSIFRFSGSDVNLMFDFEKYFGFTKTFKLEECHRFNNQLAKVSNDFILRNKHQIKKNLRSQSNISEKPVQIVYKEDEKDLNALKNILEEIDNFAGQNRTTIRDVFLLGRYAHDKPKNLKDYKYRHIKRIEFFTIHQSKGLTCDFAIVLNNTTGKYGFPSNIADDPLIISVLSETDPFPHSEERRLMYVAMTRARNQVFLLVDKRFPSPFINEFEKDIAARENVVLCSECGGIMKIRKGPFGQFWGCSNFPLCQNKRKFNRESECGNLYESRQEIAIGLSR